MTITLDALCHFFQNQTPLELAEEWDNVGLLVGDKGETIQRVMTCLTITPASAEEAIRRQADVIVTHHPLPFKPLKKLTADQTAGGLLLKLIRAGIAIYSPHTAFDSAAEGINQQLATGLGLLEIQPLIYAQPGNPATADLGSGRWGLLAHPISLGVMAERLKAFLGLNGLHAVGDLSQTIGTVAVACGSAGSFLEPARQAKCDLLVTGETSFHTCLEAEAQGIALLLPGHFASERFAVERLAQVLAAHFSPLDCWASETEQDPLRWV